MQIVDNKESSNAMWYEVVNFRINYLMEKASRCDLSRFQKVELMLLIEYEHKLKQRMSL